MVCSFEVTWQAMCPGRQHACAHTSTRAHAHTPRTWSEGLGHGPPCTRTRRPWLPSLSWLIRSISLLSTRLREAGGIVRRSLLIISGAAKMALGCSDSWSATVQAWQCLSVKHMGALVRACAVQGQHTGVSVGWSRGRARGHINQALRGGISGDASVAWRTRSRCTLQARVPMCPRPPVWTRGVVGCVRALVFY